MFGFGTKKKYKDINVEEFKSMMSQDDTVVLDVRTPAEKSEGTIPGNRLINMMSPDFLTKISQLDKERTYLVYCRSGNRSGKACSIMTSQGFDHVYNLRGGIGAWNASH